MTAILASSITFETSRALRNADLKQTTRVCITKPTRLIRGQNIGNTETKNDAGKSNELHTNYGNGEGLWLCQSMHMSE